MMGYIFANMHVYICNIQVYLPIGNVKVDKSCVESRHRDRTTKSFRVTRMKITLLYCTVIRIPAFYLGG